METKYPPSYTFNIKTINNSEVIVRRKNDEPNFEINKELRKAVYEGMPRDISVEEKAIFIYYRLCKIMKYDENYIYDTKVSEEHKYNSDFSREHLENISPGDPIVCWDFSRIYSKFVNELGPKIEAVTLAYTGSNSNHWLTGFYTDKVSLMLDAVDINGNDKNNDLTRIKNGIWPGNMRPR